MAESGLILSMFCYFRWRLLHFFWKQLRNQPHKLSALGLGLWLA